MSETKLNAPEKFMHRLLIQAYHPQETDGTKRRIGGKSALDIPAKTVFYSFLLAVLIALVVGNISMYTLKFLSAHWDLPSIEEANKDTKAGDFAGVSDNDLSMAIIDRLLPHWKSKFQDTGQIKNLLNKSFKEKAITVQGIADFIERPQDKDKLKDMIIGDINRDVWGLHLFPFFEPQSPDKVADAFGLYKNYNETYTDDIKDPTWKRFIFMSAIQKTRSSLSSNILHPRRLLAALGGYIQWLTFIGAIWCFLLLLLLRKPWCKLQQQLTIENHLPWHSKDKDVWSLLVSSPYVIDLDKPVNYQGSFIVVRLIKEVVNIHKYDKSISLYNLIQDRVEAYRNSIDIAEYEIINFLIWITPSFGFLGTIFGIIAAMENAAAIFAASTPVEQGIALEKVSASLGTAFDTSYIALFLLMPMSYFLAQTRKAEANLFEEIEYEAVRNLPPQLEKI
jgi:hypothetical protein